MHSTKRYFEWILALILFVSCGSTFTSGYSVLTHEQVVDLMWKDHIQPLLQKRFPDATEQDLQKAHAYAYGGCVLQDMGYYPVRQQVLQRSCPLRAQWRLCGSAPAGLL